jgi:hypothetical protein
MRRWAVGREWFWLCAAALMLALPAAAGAAEPADASAGATASASPAALASADAAEPASGNAAQVAGSAGTPATGGGAMDAAAVEAVIAATEAEGLAVESYEYRSGGRRDPFVPLISAEPVKPEDDENRKPGVNDIAIVGFVWGPRVHLALAETFWGTGLLLHEGDKLRDGRVLRITPDAVTVRQDGFGVSRQIKLTVGSGEEKRNER